MHIGYESSNFEKKSKVLYFELRQDVMMLMVRDFIND